MMVTVKIQPKHMSLTLIPRIPLHDVQAGGLHVDQSTHDGTPVSYVQLDSNCRLGLRGFNPGRGFMGSWRSLISFNLYKKHIPRDRGKWLKRRGRSVWDCLPAKYTLSDHEKGGKMQQLK
jgi:hypothetical protein